MLPLPADIVVPPFALRHLVPTHDIAMALYDVFVGDAENMRFWLRGEKIKSWDVVFKGLERAYKCDNMYMYYIVIKDKIVGEIGFASIEQEKKSAHIDYWLIPSVRGQGLIDRFLPYIEELAFDRLKLKQVVLGIDVDNIASCKIAERNGYTLKGISKSGKVWVDGSLHDECEYVKNQNG